MSGYRLTPRVRVHLEGERPYIIPASRPGTHVTASYRERERERRRGVLYTMRCMRGSSCVRGRLCFDREEVGRRRAYSIHIYGSWKIEVP